MLHSRLFDGAYELGENISNTDTVIKACKEIMPEKSWDELESILKSDDGK